MTGAGLEVVDCCVVGGGPAGAVAALLLARAGLRVSLLEKHADFLRDFRGDTLHASTIALMAELGLEREFFALPHRTVTTFTGMTDDGTYTLADFRRLPGRYRYIVFMPQWHFLDFLTREAARYPTFQLHRNAEVVAVDQTDGRVRGVVYRTPDGARRTVRATLTIGADGRHSTVRAALALRSHRFGAPMDVLWFRLSRRESDPALFARLSTGRMLVLIDRGEYWQLAYVIPKGGYETVRARGLDAFRDAVGRLAPHLRDRLPELRSWDDVAMLSVQVDRLRRWQRPGVLLIGDAAHAMSPIGGVGINLAVQDAVAAANRIAGPLQDGTLRRRDLVRVQLRRMPPTVLTQLLQRLIQRRVLARVLTDPGPLTAPYFLRVIDRHPVLQGLTARFIGLGFRPEHVQTRSAWAAPAPAPAPAPVG
jgi:2-polyprenyl-6-methoxyphenol hydroxylase-like FAD-dependent oxidoreductase